MTVHYHGTPITPNRVLIEEMAGANFFVSYAAAAQLRLCHEIGQLVHIDWPAYSIWKQGITPDLEAYYAFIEPWLEYITTTATIPDFIEADEAENSRLVRAWPFRKEKGLPVYHMHESIDRLIALIDVFPWVAIGSSGQYAEVLSPQWERRMDEIFRHILRVFGRIPRLHMMRGMQLLNSKKRWPFFSGDSALTSPETTIETATRPPRCEHAGTPASVPLALSIPVNNWS
jgi:hypothetical protein